MTKIFLKPKSIMTWIVKTLQKQELSFILKHNSRCKIFNSYKSIKTTNISQIDEENKSFYIWKKNCLTFRIQLKKSAPVKFGSFPGEYQNWRVNHLSCLVKWNLITEMINVPLCTLIGCTESPIPNDSMPYKYYSLCCSQAK